MDLLNLLWILLISLGINYFFFVFAWIFKSDVFTDITYALTFVSLLIIFAAWYRNLNIVQIFILALIIVWAGRLGFYLFSRIIRTKVDHRFDNMRNSFIKFFAFWTLQALTVFIIIAPAILFISYNQSFLLKTNTGLSSLFLLISVAGLIIEYFADKQSDKFYLNKNKNPNGILRSGIWKYSRHPNYFGELLFWYGISFAIISAVLINNYTSGNYLIILVLISPIYLTLMLIYLSGIKLSEIKKFKKGISLTYYDYILQTPALVPLIGKKGPLKLTKKYFKKPDKLI